MRVCVKVVLYEMLVVLMVNTLVSFFKKKII